MMKKFLELRYAETSMFLTISAVDIDISSEQLNEKVKKVAAKVKLTSSPSSVFEFMKALSEDCEGMEITVAHDEFLEPITFGLRQKHAVKDPNAPKRGRKPKTEQQSDAPKPTQTTPYKMSAEEAAYALYERQQKNKHEG